jgi:endonuclease-3
LSNTSTHAGTDRRPSSRESRDNRIKRSHRIIEILQQSYPEAKTALDHQDPYELIMATILSAQCTDKRVNLVTPALFRKYPDAHRLARARIATVEKLIMSTGFYRNKSKNLIGCAKGIVNRHGGRVPDTMDALTALDGVGRKTANCVLGNAFGKNIGVVVDTHVKRISNLLRLSRHSDPVKIEQDLMDAVPTKLWTQFSHLLIAHGRAVCIARRPQCQACELFDLCPGRKTHDAG